MADNSEQWCFESLTPAQRDWQLLQAIQGSSALGALTDVQLRATPVETTDTHGQQIEDNTLSILTATGQIADAAQFDYTQDATLISIGKAIVGTLTETGTLILVTAALGSPSDPPWDGITSDATVISILKTIAVNTAP